MQRSMSLLKHQRIELMQVHNLVDLDAHLKTLRRWKAEGRIKYIGVTHYTTSSYPDLIAIIEREKLDFVQFNYSVTTREAEKRLLPLCADRGVAVIINRAFEDGNLFTQGTRQAPAAVGGGVRRDQLGAGVPEVRAGASGRHLRDPGHRQGAQPGRQPRRRHRTAAGRKAARTNRRRDQLANYPAPACRSRWCARRRGTARRPCPARTTRC